MPGKISSAFQNLFCLSAATACSAAPTVYSALSTTDPTVGALAGLGLGGFTVLSGLLTGRLGEMWNESLVKRMTDPQTVLQNHDLLRLSGEAAALTLRAEAKRRAASGQKEIAGRIEKLAGKLPAEWSTLAETDGWNEHLQPLSREDIVGWMSDAGVDWSKSPSLDQATWLSILAPIVEKHDVRLPTPVLNDLAADLFAKHATAVREVLKRDAGNDGEAFAGLLLILHAETLHNLTELASGQDKLQAELAETGTDVRDAVNTLLESGSAVAASAERLVAGHEKFFQRHEELLFAWRQSSDAWDNVLPTLDRIETKLDEANAKLTDLSSQPPTIVVPAPNVTVNLPSSEAQTRSAEEAGDVVPKKAEPRRRAVKKRVDRTSVFISRKEPFKALKKVFLTTRQPKPGELRAAILTGMAGIGKSLEASHFVETKTGWRKKHPESHQVVRLVLDDLLMDRVFPKEAGDPSAEEGLRDELLNLLRINPAPDQAWQLLADRLTHPVSLLIVENVDTPDRLRAVDDLLQELSSVADSPLHVLMTSRVRGHNPQLGWHEVALWPFDNEQILDLFQKEIGNDACERFGSNELLKLGADRLGGLPLALHLAAGHLRKGKTPQQFWDELLDSGLKLRAADPALRGRFSDDEAREILRSSFDFSWRTLREELTDQGQSDVDGLLDGLAALGHANLSGVGRSLARALTGLTETRFETLLQAATALNLLPDLSELTDRLIVHPLIAVWLAEKDGGPVVLDRMTDWFCERLPTPMQDDPRGQPWVEIHEESAALLDLLERVPVSRIPDLLRTGDEFAFYNGPFPAWIAVCDRLMGRDVSPADRSVQLRVLSWVCHRAGEMDRAMAGAEAKRALDENRDDPRELGEAHTAIADIHAAQGRLDLALASLQNGAMPAYSQAGYEQGLAETHGRIADVLQARGELDEALRIRREEELPVYERLGDVRSKAVTQGNIADVLQARGELDEALRIRREEQLPVYERLGDVRSKAVTQGKIADVLQARGELDEALRIRREEQLPVYERLGDVREKAVTQGQIADVLQARGELDKALRIRREEELPVYERLGDVRATAVTQGKIADVLQARGELDEALRIRREEELPVYERLGDVRLVAITQGQIADVLQARGELDKALRIRREEELPVYERLGDVRAKAVCRANLALTLLERNAPGDREEADELLRQALAAAEKMGIPEAGRIREIMDDEGF